MKKLVTLQKLIDEVENETLDPEMTLIEAESITVLDDDYPIHTEETDSEDQEDQ